MMPSEPTVRTAVIDLLADQVPALAEHVSGPTDAPPTEVTAYFYMGPTEYNLDGMEVATTLLTVTIATPYLGSGTYTVVYDEITALAVATYRAFLSVMANEFAGLVITGPVTISQTGIGQFRPTGTETVAASVTIGAECKGAYEL